MIGSSHQTCRVPRFQRSKVIFPLGNRMMECVGSVPRSTRIDPGRVESVLQLRRMKNDVVGRVRDESLGRGIGIARIHQTTRAGSGLRSNLERPILTSVELIIDAVNCCEIVGYSRALCV